MESPNEPKDINLDEKAEFIIDIKHEPVDPDLSITPKYALVKDIKKEGNNGESLDSPGCIKSEEVDLKSEDEKDSFINFGAEKLDEETTFPIHVKRAKVVQKYAGRKKKDKEKTVKEDTGADKFKTSKCALCDYSTIHLGHFTRHLQRHKTLKDFQYTQTPDKAGLNRHVLCHKDADQVATYKCNNCDYQTRIFNNLQKHAVLHKTIDELTVYKCPECDYQTIRSYDLKRHHATKHKRDAGHTNGTPLAAQFLLESKDMEKGENNGESLDSTDCIKSEEVELKSEDEKDSSINFGPEKLEQETEFARYVKGAKVAERDVAHHRKENVLETPHSEAPAEGDKGAGVFKTRKCAHCDYSTIRLDVLKRHLERHKTIQDFQCDQCSYQTWSKYNLMQHIFRHKEPTYKCTECEYQTRRPGDLKQHLKRHKKVDELSMYKCRECGYQTFRSHDLKRHNLRRHRSGAKILLEGEDMEKEENNKESLDSSSFIIFEEVDLKSEDEKDSLINVGPEKPEETEFARHDKRIKLAKKDAVLERKKNVRKAAYTEASVKMDKGAGRVKIRTCGFCDYSTSYLSNMKSHLGRHKMIQDFKCTQCSYQTFSNDNLNRHIFRHKDADQVDTVHKCTDCDYKTGLLGDFTQHLERHKIINELPVFKCFECDYQTIRSNDLKRHHLSRHTSGDGHTSGAPLTAQFLLESDDMEEENNKESLNSSGCIKAEEVDLNSQDEKCSEMENEENSGESLDSSGFIKFEEIDLKSEDEKDSLIKLGPEKLEEKNKFTRHVKRFKNANSKTERIRKENVRKTTYLKAAEEGDKGADRVKIHECAHCDYSTKRLNNFKRHLQRHKTIQDFQCAQCSYRTSSKHNLVNHLFRHKDTDQIATYKCTDCGYEAKRLDNLKRHLQRHKTIQDFQCAQCNYRTSCKDNLLRHVFNHKKDEQVVSYKCTDCDYKTRRLGNLKQHLMRHKTVDELTVYKCRECDYRTIHSSALNRHHRTRHRSGAGQTSGSLLIAQFLLEGLIKLGPENPEEKTKFARNVKRIKVASSEAARIKKENVPEAAEEGDKGADRGKIHKCAHCDYSTNRLNDLKRHLQRHKTIQDFQCAQCSYQTSRRDSLIRHVFSHKKAKQVAAYNRLGRLKQHLKQHKTVYQCRECDYQTIRAYSLKRHHLTRHKSGAGHTSGTHLTSQFLLESGYMEKEENNEKSLDRSGCMKSEDVQLKSEDEKDSKYMEKEEKNGESLDSSGYIKSEEVQVKSEDEKDSAGKSEEQTTFAQHVKGDQGADRVNIHKCEHCDYSTKRLKNLKRHLQRHKTFQNFQCAQCSYQTSNKENLYKHVFRHRDPDKVRNYKCKDCDFQTKHLESIKQHLKRHKTADELIMYKCRQCDYQTFRKPDLNRHVKRHTSGAANTSGGRVKLKKA